MGRCENEKKRTGRKRRMAPSLITGSLTCLLLYVNISIVMPSLIHVLFLFFFFLIMIKKVAFRWSFFKYKEERGRVDRKPQHHQS